MSRFLAVALSIFFASPALADAPSASPRPVVLKFRVWEGDPNGSVEAGTQRLVSEPTIHTFDKKRVTLVIGEEPKLLDLRGKPILDGVRVMALPYIQRDGKVLVDLECEISRPGPVQGERAIKVSSSMNATVRLQPGETDYLGGTSRWPSDTKTEQSTWFDVTCDLPKGVTAAPEPPAEPAGRAIMVKFRIWEKVLNARVPDSAPKLVAAPTIHTIDGRRVTLTIGDEINEGEELILDGIRVMAKPTIQANGQISAELSCKLSKPQEEAGGRLHESAQSVVTKVAMKTGETFVIAGLKEDRQTKEGTSHRELTFDVTFEFPVQQR